MKIYATVVAMSLLISTSSQALLPPLNTVVTDGNLPFAEGVLKDYLVLKDADLVCNDPFVIGRYISCRDEVSVGGIVHRAPSRSPVWVETNGALGGMVVVDGNGKEVCRDPLVSNQFRGPMSYIKC